MKFEWDRVTCRNTIPVLRRYFKTSKHSSREPSQCSSLSFRRRL